MRGHNILFKTHSLYFGDIGPGSQLKKLAGPVWHPMFFDKFWSRTRNFCVHIGPVTSSTERVGMFSTDDKQILNTNFGIFSHLVGHQVFLLTYLGTLFPPNKQHFCSTIPRGLQKKI